MKFFNQSVKTLTSSNDDMIIISKDEVDKRINIYQLNKHYNFHSNKKLT